MRRAAVAPPFGISQHEHLPAAVRWCGRLAIPRPRANLIKPPAAAPAGPQLATRPTTRWPRRFNWAIAAALAIGIALLPPTRQFGTTIEREQQTLFASVASWIWQRSAIDMRDDFSTGLSGWRGDPGWAGNWAFDPAGCVRPGKLALLSASLPLSNYRLELCGQIQQKSLSWAFRASGVRNYYAMKIAITRPGPIPQAAIVRYAVVNGVAADRVQSPLPFDIRADTFYHIQTTAYGDRFVTWVNGRIVDAFSDQRHPSGGVGLFTEPGEASHILWVRVADRDDLLGRVCAYFSGDPGVRKAGIQPILAVKRGKDR